MPHFDKKHSRNNPLPLKNERNFGLTMSLFFLLVTCLSFYEHHKLNIYTLTVACCFLFMAIFFTKYLIKLNFLWTKLGILIKNITTPILLIILFYAVITPLNFFLIRLPNRDPLKLKWDNTVKSYWSESHEDYQFPNFKDQF